MIARGPASSVFAASAPPSYRDGVARPSRIVAVIEQPRSIDMLSATRRGPIAALGTAAPAVLNHRHR